MELRHLRYFVAVAEERHFTRAADRLQMAQPPLSQAIRQLERELGTQLLHRTTRQVALTAAGKLFYERATSILTELDRASADALRAAGGELGRLAIGFTGSVTYELLPALVRAFREEVPGVELELHGELFTPEQVARIVAGELDLGFLRPPVNAPGLQVEVLREEPLIAVVPAGHPLAAVDVVELSDLADQPFITYPSGLTSVTREAVQRACVQAGFRPRVVQEVRETITMVCFVAAGLGVALVPASVRFLYVEGAEYRPVRNPEAVTLAAVWRRSDHSPALVRFLALLRSRQATLNDIPDLLIGPRFSIGRD